VAARLNHVNLTVADLARSTAFYREHFGLDRTVHDDPGFRIIGDESGSLLALREGAPAPAAAEAFHFGFELGDRDLVLAARERLREAGVPELEFDDRDQWARVQVTDPDGYRVELFG
jgi:catechol 2,3-dioxygenase-like lactoylglutathione lyase family enzyme